MDPGPEKSIKSLCYKVVSRTNDKTWLRPVDYITLLYGCKFPDLENCTHSGFVRECSCFLGNTHGGKGALSLQITLKWLRKEFTYIH